MADAVFEDPRLAAAYDPLDPDRSDLEVYAAIVEEFGARSVLDVGCGTGTFACLLANQGVAVIGLDPAAASLNVARSKAGADRVTWVPGDVGALPATQVDLATMTGNVAQVFIEEDAWISTLRTIRASLRPSGHLVFESRIPDNQAWLEWTPERTRTRADTAADGTVESWVEVTDASGGLVSFVSTFRFERDGSTLTSQSTLRFRSKQELASSLDAAGLVTVDVRDAPDRPGREYVFVVQRAD